MGYKIDEIEGIGPAYREKLTAAGLETTDDFLAKCCDVKGRKAIEAETGLSGKLILRWTNLADMMRISGVGPQYSELLEASGVDTVKELRTRNSENLAAKMVEINDVKKLARTTPAVSVVKGWVEQAKTTEPTITH